MEFKQCKKCLEMLETEHFYYHDGRYSAQCKACKKATVKERYNNDPLVRERMIEASKRYYRKKKAERADLLK